MEMAIVAIISFGVTWWFLNEFLYSPRAQIKRYWKEIIELSAIVTRLKNSGKDSEGNEVYPMDLSGFESQIEKRGKLVNALLDYHFDPEDDKEYIEGHRA